MVTSHLHFIKPIQQMSILKFQRVYLFKLLGPYNPSVSPSATAEIPVLNVSYQAPV